MEFTFQKTRVFNKEYDYASGLNEYKVYSKFRFLPSKRNIIIENNNSHNLKLIESSYLRGLLCKILPLKNIIMRYRDKYILYEGDTIIGFIEWFSDLDQDIIRFKIRDIEYIVYYYPDSKSSKHYVFKDEELCSVIELDNKRIFDKRNYYGRHDSFLNDQDLVVILSFIDFSKEVNRIKTSLWFNTREVTITYLKNHHMREVIEKAVIDFDNWHLEVSN